MDARSVLIGWGNAQRSQLAAYAKLHKALGLEPISVIPDTRAGLFDPDAYARSLEPVARALASRNPARPLLVHLFSENGFIGWAALLEALDRIAEGELVRGAIRGIVLDSAPALWAIRGKLDFARRFALGMTPAIATKLGRGPRERLAVVTPLLTLGFLAFQYAFPRPVRRMLSAAERVERLEPRAPQLFLYGGADLLVPPADIERWIERQRAKGLDVTAERFERAKHVALYPDDPRRYREALGAFVDKTCGARPASGSS